MCRRSKNCHTIGQSYNGTKWSRLLNRLLKACCLIVWQWHKEELMQKKIVYIFIKQVSDPKIKFSVLMQYIHIHLLRNRLYFAVIWCVSSWNLELYFCLSPFFSDQDMNNQSLLPCWQKYIQNDWLIYILMDQWARAWN